MKPISTFHKLEVYQKAFKLAMDIFHLTQHFPREERYALTDQIRRSSRSVCSNLAEAYRKRKYPKSFVAKINDSEGEAAETQVWLEFAYSCGYLDLKTKEKLLTDSHQIIGKLVRMRIAPEKWCSTT